MAIRRRVARDILEVQDVYKEFVETDTRIFQLGELFIELPDNYPFARPRFWTETMTFTWDEEVYSWSGVLHLLPVLESALLLAERKEGPLRFPLAMA